MKLLLKIKWLIFYLFFSCDSFLEIVFIYNLATSSFDYTFTLGYPDGSVQIIEGTFDSDDLGKYTMDVWTAWGGGYASYRILKVVNDGTKFVVTAL